MFGINDPGIWIIYLLALLCLGFSIWFGIRYWNHDAESDNTSKSDKI